MVSSPIDFHKHHYYLALLRCHLLHRPNYHPYQKLRKILMQHLFRIVHRQPQLDHIRGLKNHSSYRLLQMPEQWLLQAKMLLRRLQLKTF
jgi:hypothetical protein